MTYICGLNSAYHESSVCLIKDGQIIAIAEEERFNRKKHAKPARVDNPDELPLEALNYCLKKAGITFDEVDYVGYSLNPKVRLNRNIQHQHPYEVTPGDFGSKEGEELFYQKNIEVEQKVKELGFNGRFFYLNHHDCHAASSYFVSAFNKAAVLVVDGIGEFESTTLYQGRGNTLNKLGGIVFPNSLGFLWEKICKYLGFSEYDACKVMGLASYGNPDVHRNQLRSFVHVQEDGSFTIDDRITQFRNEDYAKLEELFGFEKRGNPVRALDGETKKYADVAAALQELTEEVVIKLARWLKRKTGAKQLCLSGGVALNCVANGKLLEERIFDDVFIQPAAHDAGTALGAAFYVWNQVQENPRSYVFNSPFLSAEFSDEEIRAALEKSGLTYEKSDAIEIKTAELLNDGNVIAWFRGAMEIGPRALGNRSLLYDPRRTNAVALLNEKVKHREPFRPFCPSVLEEKASEWFVISGNPTPAKYMLMACKVREEKRSKIPAVTHVDGTARIQTVERKVNPSYYRLLQEFEKLTGVPVLLNTSFNDQEPIVCTPQDAINTFLKTGIDYLIMGDYIVTRGEQRE